MLKWTCIAIACLSLLAGCSTFSRRSWNIFAHRSAGKSAPPEATPAQSAQARAVQPVPAQAPTSEPAALADQTQPTTPASAPANPYAGYTLIGQPQVVDAVMLQVNEQVITAKQVIDPVHKDLLAIPTNISAKDFRSRAEQIIADELQRLISQALVLDQARKNLSDDEKQYIDSQVQEEIRQMVADDGGSRTKLDDDLRAKGSSLDEVTKQRRRQLTSQYYLRKRFASSASITGAMLWRYYKQHPEKFSTPKKVQMQILSVPYASFYVAGSAQPTDVEKRTAKTQAHAKAAAALARIRAGEDFAKVVKAYSTGYNAQQGGVYELMAPDNFREACLEDAGFAMKAGQVSKVIDGQEGCYIVKVLKVQPGKVVPYAQAQEQIAKQIRQEQVDRQTVAYLNRLYSHAAIFRASQFRQRVLDQVMQEFYKH